MTQNYWLQSAWNFLLKLIFTFSALLTFLYLLVQVLQCVQLLFSYIYNCKQKRMKLNSGSRMFLWSLSLRIFTFLFEMAAMLFPCNGHCSVWPCPGPVLFLNVCAHSMLIFNQSNFFVFNQQNFFGLLYISVHF